MHSFVHITPAKFKVYFDSYLNSMDIFPPSLSKTRLHLMSWGLMTAFTGNQLEKSHGGPIFSSCVLVSIVSNILCFSCPLSWAIISCDAESESCQTITQTSPVIRPFLWTQLFSGTALVLLFEGSVDFNDSFAFVPSSLALSCP